MPDDRHDDEVPRQLQGDPLSRMRAYRVATKLQETAWSDAESLRKNPLTEETANQLYTAIGSIAANLAEGYSRSSGKDGVRLFEYALGSARESMVWYINGAPVLGGEVTTARCDALEEIRRLLLTAIPAERNPNPPDRNLIAAEPSGSVTHPQSAGNPQPAVRS